MNSVTEPLKKEAFEILKTFVSICERLNLKYFLIYGTLLGAVRHKGFIPWDDDIDVGMLREDYDIFIKKASQYLPKEYFLQTFETDKKYINNFAKIRNSNTTFIETTAKNLKINHGIYIDIFPLDFYNQSNFFDFIKRLYSFRISREFYVPGKSFSKKISGLISRIIYPSVTRVVKKQEKLITSCKISNKVKSFGGAYGKKEIMPLEWFKETVELEFEGLKVLAPKSYDEYLKQLYGDYMQLPPVEKRIAHHFAEVIDTEKPYTEYIKA